jgi:hypothetical protein
MAWGIIVIYGVGTSKPTLVFMFSDVANGNAESVGIKRECPIRTLEVGTGKGVRRTVEIYPS